MRDEWYVAGRGRGENSRRGPLPLGRLRQLVDEGQVRGGDLVWREGMSDWRRADQCDELFAPHRGYGPDDDRPYRRHPPPQPSSGWVVALVVGGVAVVVCFLGCAGFGLVAWVNARTAAGASLKSAITMPPPAAVAPDEAGSLADDMTLANRDLNGDPPPGLGRRIPFGASEVFYADAVTLDEAQQVKDRLGDQGEFPDDHGATVQLDRVLGTYQIRFCLQPDADFDGHAWEAKQVRDDIVNNLFRGADVEVHLCDQNMNPVRVIRAGD